MNHSYDLVSNSLILESSDQYIQVPEAHEVRIQDPEEFMGRLQEISSPYSRMKHFLLSSFNIWYDDPTYEGRIVQRMTIAGLSFGCLLGSMIKGRDLNDEYTRQHNASVFDNQHRARRHRIDTFVYNYARRGLSSGFKAALLCGSVGVISFGSITIRNKLYYPDWAVGFISLGALSRCWLGLRGIIGGGGLGLIGGTIGFGLACLCEQASGMSVAQFRYLEEIEFLRKHQAKLNQLQRSREHWVDEMLNK